MTTCYYFKSHRLLSRCLTPFYILPDPDQWSKEFYLIVFSLPFFFFFLFPFVPLLLVCFPILSKSFIFTVDISYSLFTFLRCSYSHSTYIKFHSTVIPIDPVLVFLPFCSHWCSTFSILLQTSQYTLPSSYTIVPQPFRALLMLYILLSLSLPWFHPISYQFSFSPHNIFPSFSHLIFCLSQFIRPAISLHLC